MAAFDLEAFHREAVRTPSHEDVTAMRELLVDALATHGADPWIDEAGNVRAERGSAGDGPHVVVNTHLDTVSPHVPYERDGDVVRGRGACDAKGPLAALVAAFLAVEPERGRVTLAVTPDEETTQVGAAALTGGIKSPVEPIDGDLYLVGEPTGLDVCTAAKGRFEATVELTGETAHAAEPETGHNAVAAAEGALASIRTFDEDVDPHPELGRPTIVPTVIEGGDATNQVPADCAITVDRRAVPPEGPDRFREGLVEAVRESIETGVAGGVTADVTLTTHDTPFLEPFATDPDHELVRTLVDAVIEAASGKKAVSRDVGAVRPFGAATEASYFAPAPTVVFGPGDLADEAGAVAHSEREYVRVSEIETATRAVMRTLERLVA